MQPKGNRLKEKILILLLLAATGCGKGGQVPSLEAPPATAPITEGAALQNVLFEGLTELSDDQPQPLQAKILDLKNILPPFDIAIESSNPNILAVTIVGSDSPTAIIDPNVQNIIRFIDVIPPPFSIQFIVTPSPVVERSVVDLTLSLIDRATGTVHFKTPAFSLSVVPAPPPIAAPAPAPAPAPEPAPAPGPTQRSAVNIIPEDFPLKRNIFASTDFTLLIQPAPPTADVGPVIWTVNSADALLTVNPKSDRFSNVVSRICAPFTLQARTFDIADKQPRTPSVNITTLCGPTHGLSLSFEKERIGAAGNIQMVFSLPNGQLETPVSKQLTTNFAPPFIFNTNVARFDETGVIFNLGITLLPPACPIGTCILKIQMTSDIAGIPNIKMTKAEDNFRGLIFTTTDAGNVR
ncbi:MAG: hypothetical protein AAB309_06785, partial [Deltaproteobacteria bacterium]